MARKINYDNWSKEELIKELRRIKETKYGLVWHRDLPEEKIDVLINPDARTPNEMFPNEMAGRPFPVLKEVKGKEIKNGGDKPVNLLIEGDNYHSLAVLNFTHEESVDLIYIDPPYNTGNNDFVYADKFNNGYVKGDDPFKHSKWLAFMEKRLKMAKHLLKRTGVVFISIDDNEVAQLKMLCDEVFEENNFINIICLKSGRDEGVKMAHKDKRLVKYKEYILVYAKEKHQVRFVPQYKEKEEWDDRYSSWLEKHNSNDCAKWEIVSLSKKLKEVGLDIADEHEILEWKISNRDNIIRLAANSSEALKRTKGKRQIVRLKTPRGLDVYAFNGQKILFASNKIKNIDGGEKLGEYVGDLWDDISYNNLHNEGGVDLPNGKKPIALIKRMLKLAAGPDAIVLDFFAGSGTTGHAVAELNEEDGGRRQFILGTNDEAGICSSICYPRMKNVDKEIGLNLKYYTCDFVEAEPTDRNKRKLVNECTDMLCIHENTFDLALNGNDFKIFRNGDRYLGIVYYEDAIGPFKKAVAKIKGHCNAYVFSMTDDPHKDQFASIADKVTLCAIPEVILKVYREIFKET